MLFYATLFGCLSLIAGALGTLSFSVGGFGTATYISMACAALCLVSVLASRGRRR